MKVIPLSEGSFTIDQSKKFVPFDTSSDDLRERSKGSLLVEVQPFVVITRNDVLLLDAGLGYTGPDSILQIHHNLVDAGIGPLEVTKVLMTHLHKDHAGGLSIYDGIMDKWSLAFPHATHYIQRSELDYAFEKGLPSYVPEELAILRDTDRVVLLEGEGDIDGYIHHTPSGGHCPWHQVFHIREDGETLFFGGDEAPQLHQMKSRFVAKYDYDGKRAMELRQQWWAQGQEERWTFLFYHDIKSPTWTSR
jgi:glyoxylase-like metal-dependent hydrolase (beta-lactamase superfamily II)